MQKSYVIEFYVGQIGADGDGGLVSEIFDTWLEEGRGPSILLNTRHYEVRDLSLNRKIYKGVFVKFRLDDFPHAGKPGGSEHELNLQADEGLIEKNYFQFETKNQLLIYQRNGHGSSADKFGDYLSHSAEDAVTFNPVLQAEPTRRLLQGGVTARKIDLSIAAPTNREMLPADNFSRAIMDVLESSGGSGIRLTITSDARSAYQNQRRLDNRVKRALASFAAEEGTKVARVSVEDEDGYKHAIDLIADRLLSMQSVEMNGKYPNPDSIHAALRTARTSERTELSNIFGE